MPRTPTLRVIKWIRTVPVVAACTHCGREFKVPITALHTDVQARENLRRCRFARHPNTVCRASEKPGQEG